MTVLLTSEEREKPDFAQALVAALMPRHHVSFLEPGMGLAGQVDGAAVVVDIGSRAGRVDLLAAARNVRLLQIMGTGTNHVDLDSWADAGIPVAHCPGSTGASALAEHVFMLMLILARRYEAMRHQLERGRWGRPFGTELGGKTLGIVGFGYSARALSVRANAFGMDVLAVSARGRSVDEAAEFGARSVGTLDDLDAMLPQCDFLSLHLPLLPDTQRLLDRRRLRLLPAHAFIVNVARGALIDELELIDALESDELGGAALDVFTDEPLGMNHPLRYCDRIVLSPHVAGQTWETAERRARVVAENCDRIAAGLAPSHLVGPGSHHETSVNTQDEESECDSAR